MIKHDIAGVVAVHTLGHATFMLHLNTSYSCAYMYEDDKVHISSKASDYKTKEEQVLKITSTANMLKGLNDVSLHNYNTVSMLHDEFKKLTGHLYEEEK